MVNLRQNSLCGLEERRRDYEAGRSSGSLWNRRRFHRATVSGAQQQEFQAM